MTVFTYGYHDPTGTLVGSLEPADVTVSIGRIPRSAYYMVVYVGGQVTYSANESGFVTDALISTSAA